MFGESTISHEFISQFQRHYVTAYIDCESAAQCFLMAYNHATTQNKLRNYPFTQRIHNAISDLMGNEIAKLRGKHIIKQLLKKHNKEIFGLIEEYNLLCNNPFMTGNISSRIKQMTATN